MHFDMKCRRRMLTVCFILNVLWFCAAGLCTYAGTYETKTVRSGSLSISMTVQADDSRAYMPREDIPFTIRVNNKGEESWLRVRCDMDQAGLDNGSFADCVKPGSEWKRVGDYLYMTVPAGRNSANQAVSGLSAPDAGRASKGAVFKLQARAEAIYKSAVTPDFNAADPWGGLSGNAVINYYSESSGGGGSGGTGIHAYSQGLKVYANPQANAYESEGNWYLVDAENHLWKFGNEAAGTFAADGWYYLNNGFAEGGSRKQWFHFDKNAIMETGWLRLDDNIWFHLGEQSNGELGAMTAGWYKDRQDGRWYYLDPVLGTMKTGWQQIGDKQYYFAELKDVSGPVWVFSLLSNTTVGRWFYGTFGLRSFGSMYQNERTPDGSYVNQDGEKV